MDAVNDKQGLQTGMFLDQYHTHVDGYVRVTAQQASRFAKEVAGDFNPIHDPNAKRFCVPGDLLFCLVLAIYGLSEKMTFTFKGMVGDGVSLRFPDSDDDVLQVTDDAGKTYLLVERHGANSRHAALVERLARQYVAFSGKNFPHYLVPLMAQHQVMFNPDRPLVIYESMTFELDRLDIDAPDMELADATLNVVNGKRGDALLFFAVKSAGQHVGKGSKKLVLSGLRQYDEISLQQFIDRFSSRKASYLGVNS